MQWAKQNLTSHSQKPVITHIVFNLTSKFDRKSQKITYFKVLISSWKQLDFEKYVIFWLFLSNLEVKLKTM
jgi:hypothetical protein